MSQRHHGVAQSQSGFVFVVALALMAGVGVLLTSGTTRSLTDHRIAERLIAKRQAFYLAEAGVDQAWAILTANPTLALPATCPATPLPVPGTRGCTITSQADGTILITGTGSVAGSQQTIQAVVEFSTATVFRWALFADAIHMHLHGGGLIDSYDSSVDPYDPAAPKDPHGATVQTNRTNPGAIGIENGTELWGDAIVGEGADPDFAIDTGGGGVIHGARSAATSNVTLPPIILPPGSPTGFPLTSCPGSNTIDVSDFISDYSSVALPDNCQVTLVGDGLIHLTDLDLGVNSALQMEGDIQISTGGLHLSSTAELRVKKGATEVYVSGPTSVIDGNLINETEIPRNFRLFVQGNRNVWLNSSTVFHGAIYVPDGEVRLFGTPEVFGSLVANHINAGTTSAPQIHYDQDLATLVPSTTGSSNDLMLRSWR